MWLLVIYQLASSPVIVLNQQVPCEAVCQSVGSAIVERAKLVNSSLKHRFESCRLTGTQPTQP